MSGGLVDPFLLRTEPVLPVQDTSLTLALLRRCRGEPPPSQMAPRPVLRRGRPRFRLVRRGMARRLVRRSFVLGAPLSARIYATGKVKTPL